VISVKIIFMTENKNQLPSKIQDLTEEQKLELFQVEELESRLEMAAAEPVVDIDVNGVCW
jgi:hypothetical protein